MVEKTRYHKLGILTRCGFEGQPSPVAHTCTEPYTPPPHTHTTQGTPGGPDASRVCGWECGNGCTVICAKYAALRDTYLAHGGDPAAFRAQEDLLGAFLRNLPDVSVCASRPCFPADYVIASNGAEERHGHGRR